MGVGKTICDFQEENKPLLDTEGEWIEANRDTCREYYGAVVVGFMTTLNG